jgi:predicted SprT family Zn-dependent metalloprotease
VTEAGLPTPEELQQRAAALFAQWRVLDTAVEIVWNGRLSTTVGRAFVRSGRIELNPKLLAEACDQVEVVLIHEAAHVAAFRLFGEHIPAHGRHWRSLMRIAGQQPEITHKLPVEHLRRKKPKRKRRSLYLRMCGSCGERVVLEQVRYGRCGGCSSRDNYLVVKTQASAAGRRALLRMSDGQVRAHFS